jgi:hypothetical protein
MYGQPDIIVEIKRLEWLGYVRRMEQNRMVKRVFEGQPGGRRKNGRSRKRWLDDIEYLKTDDNEEMEEKSNRE